MTMVSGCELIPASDPRCEKITSSVTQYLPNQVIHIMKCITYVCDFSSFEPGPKVIKLFSCSAQLRLKFIRLINVKMPTIVGILALISRINYRLWSSKPLISIYLGYFFYL